MSNCSFDIPVYIERLQMEHRINEMRLKITKHRLTDLEHRINREGSRKPATTYGEAMIRMHSVELSKIREICDKEEKEFHQSGEQLKQYSQSISPMKETPPVTKDSKSSINQNTNTNIPSIVVVTTPTKKHRAPPSNFDVNISETAHYPSPHIVTESPPSWLQMKTPIPETASTIVGTASTQPFALACPISSALSHELSTTESYYEMEKQKTIPFTKAGDEDEPHDKDESIASTLSIDDEETEDEEEMQQSDQEEDEETEEDTEEEALTASQRVDNALAAYYDFKGRSYYEDEEAQQNKYGKFLEFFEENGFDEDGIDDELALGAEVDDCQFTDFDDDFPLNTDREYTEEEKQLETFRILQHCYLHGFDIRVKCGFDPLSDMHPTHLFMCRYMDVHLKQDKQIDFNLTERDLAHTKQLYTHQCTAIFGPKLSTSNMFGYGLAVGVKNNNFPFMQYVIDAYLRQRLQHILKDPERHTVADVPISQFLDQNMKFIDEKMFDKGRIKESIMESVDDYTRVCAPMMVTRSMTLIQDDLSHVIEYLIIANHLIMNEMMQMKDGEGNAKAFPFQFDMMIACNEVKTTEQISRAELDELDEEEQEAQERAHLDEENKRLNEDMLGNVLRKLIENKLRYQEVSLSAIRRPKDKNQLTQMDEVDKKKLLEACGVVYGVAMKDICEGWKDFRGITNTVIHNDDYKQFCVGMCRLRVCLLQRTIDDMKMYKGLNISMGVLFEIVDFEMNCDYINEWMCDVLDEKTEQPGRFEAHKDAIVKTYGRFASLVDDGAYPHKRRVNMLIDRRSNDYENPERYNCCDNVIFYECPEGANRLPIQDTLVPESFFNLSQKCMVPKVGYRDGVNEAMYMTDMEVTDRIRNSTVSCRTARSGNLLIFTFHVISPDIIKCYLFREFQFQRFFPQDIKHVLPHLFNLDYGGNKEMVENEAKIYDIISQLTFSDKLFDSWFSNRIKK